jgi:anti-sigma factor ChrR (cupin superfamily)
MDSLHPLPRMTLVHELPWRDLMPGIVRRTLWAGVTKGDPAVPREMSMVRYESGAKVPLHEHVDGDEIVFVIEGILSDEYGEITAGNVGYRPNGCVHSLYSTNGATTLSFLLGGGAMVSERPVKSPQSLIINVNAMPWQSADEGRFQSKSIWSDETTDRRCILAKFPPGALLPPDQQAGEMLFFQVEGTFADETGVLAPGNMGYRPYGSRHSGFSEHGGISLIYIWGR